MTDFSPPLALMAQAARRTARGFAREFGEIGYLQSSLKGQTGFAANTHTKMSEALREELAPSGYGFYDDSPSLTSHTRCWVATPLDGAINFLHGIPAVAISIALEDEGECIAGVVYNPLTGELFRTERGVGAFLNNRRLRVSARNQLTEAIVAVHPPGTRSADFAPYTIQQATLAPKISGLRQSGCPSLDLALLATGRLDGFWGYSLTPQAIAAGILLVREAGGHVTDMQNIPTTLASPFGGHVVAAPASLHEKMHETLTKAHPRQQND
ncbi:MAG: inositol monophosphatase family protein [Parvularculales bacterium]